MALAIDQLARHFLLAGDKEAGEALYKEVTPQLFQRLRRMTTNLDDIEEVLQDTWIRVWENAGKYDSRCLFLPWIFRIACNRLFDLWRRRGRRPVESLPEAEVDACQPLPIDWLFAAETEERLHHCIGELSEEDRKIIVGLFWEERTFEEVHAQIGKRPTVSATRSRYYRALNQLLDCMNLDELKAAAAKSTRAPSRQKRKK